MGVLLERARKALGGGGVPELPAAEPYHIQCVCGEQLVGYRHDHRQFLACSVCGRLRLILPLSSYPRPIVYEAPPNSDVARVQVVVPARPVGERVRMGLGRLGHGLVAMLWCLVPPARWFSAVRLTIVAMLLMVAGTVWLTIHLSGRGSLTSEIAALRREWIADLEAGNFSQASAKLNRAAADLRRYNIQSPDAREIQQHAAELDLIANLLDRPIDDVFRERKAMSPMEAELYFRERLKYPALVFDAYLTQTPGNDPASTSFRIDASIFVGQDVAHVDASNLDLFKDHAPSGTGRVLFAARVAMIEPGLGPSDWVVRLVPDSGVYLTWRLSMEKLGWPMDEQTRELLDAQTAAVMGAAAE